MLAANIVNEYVIATVTRKWETWAVPAKTKHH
jgi:hypothetical protein